MLPRFQLSLVGPLALLTILIGFPTVLSKPHANQLSVRHHAHVRHAKRVNNDEANYKHKAKNCKFDPIYSNGKLLKIPCDAARVNGRLLFGLLPDDGTTGGPRQSMAGIIKHLHDKEIGIYGFYAQLHDNEVFSGYQFKWILDDLQKCQSMFIPAVMPCPKSWYGLTWEDSHQAVAIAKVCRNITDLGIGVSLRFAHEMNWYQRAREYSGNAKHFKEAWAVVTWAVRKYAPEVLMFWCPNVAHDNNVAEYHEYAPEDFDKTVDIVGFDYYPKEKPKKGHFLKMAKYFHDTFASDSRKMIIGETGLHYDGPVQDKVDWLDQIADAKDQLPHLVGVVWYNQRKDRDYKIVGDGTSNLLEAKLE
ncbi:hypothetical protein O181_051246 [Austropuccinia psidii MF-1]|uniref:GH26 domain-containing protein n=1 Tax=Austropuccinia psidii MF-1 TaxID=1389203 RepID=A0A9Q3DW17_9BASI|nr:hypothetical protein [Austropuccinia psidii MF-1]